MPRYNIHQIAEMYTTLRQQMDDLVEIINDKGGADFLRHGVMPCEIPSPLSKDDIRRLLMLVHPDKHDGKSMAVEMTQKLLKIRRDVL